MWLSASGEWVSMRYHASRPLASCGLEHSCSRTIPCRRVPGHAKSRREWSVRRTVGGIRMESTPAVGRNHGVSRMASWDVFTTHRVDVQWWDISERTHGVPITTTKTTRLAHQFPTPTTPYSPRQLINASEERPPSKSALK